MLFIINNYKQNPDLPQMKRIKNKKDFILKHNIYKRAYRI